MHEFRSSEIQQSVDLTSNIIDIR